VALQSDGQLQQPTAKETDSKRMPLKTP